MDKLIKNTANYINQVLCSLEKTNQASQDDEKNGKFIETLNMLGEFVKWCSTDENKSIRSFCQQLESLLHYNETFALDIWNKLYNDIQCILQDPDGAQGEGASDKYCLVRMALLFKVKQRKLQFYQLYGKQKSLQELLSGHKDFFKAYLSKCIALHSKVQVQNLADNIDDLLRNVFRLENVSITTENQQTLNCIDIPIDCSNRELYTLDSVFLARNTPYKTVDNNPNYFLPSVEQQKLRRGGSLEIGRVLQSKRWIVILGDPGNAKTTLLRWLTYVFAQTAQYDDQEINFKGKFSSRVCIRSRIPVLIRIGEFASWIEQNQTKTLIDYIGEHTWFREHYCHDDKGRNVLKEAVLHGHTLILLDGLDEILEIGRRGDIVNLIKKFIDEYVRNSSLLSPFDNEMIHSLTVNNKDNVIAKSQPPAEYDGNQIIITSRVVGYQLFPLTGSLIDHYLILPMHQYEAEQFVSEWIKEVEKGFQDVFDKNGIKLNKTIILKQMVKITNIVKKVYEKNSSLSMSNYSLISLICTSVFKSSDELDFKSRVEIYDHTVRSSLHTSMNQNSVISDKVLTNFLIELALYLHLQSPSGLIDAFDMKQLCYQVLQQQNILNDRIKMHEYANDLIALLSSDVGIVAERGLHVFCFLHLSFQEYLVALGLVRDASMYMIVERILTFVINPRFREALLLTIAWISWKWPFDEYNKFCESLVTSSRDYAAPFGTLILFDAFKDILKLPSNSTIFTAINNLLHHKLNVLSRIYLIPNLSRLPKEVIQQWMKLYLNNKKYLLKFFQSLIATLDNRSSFLFNGNDQEFYLMIYQQLWSVYNTSFTDQIIMDQIRRNTINLNNASNDFFNEKLSLYFFSYDITTSDIHHPLIFSIIMAIWGEIHLKNMGNIFKISFQLKHTRHSQLLLPPIKNYLDDTNECHKVEVQTLIKEYETILHDFTLDNTSLEIIDSFIALICLQGLGNPLIYQNYNQYQAFPLALDRLKGIFYNLAHSKKTVTISGKKSDEYFMTSQITSVVAMLSSQPSHFDEQRLELLIAYTAAFAKLADKNWINRFLSANLPNEKLRQYLDFHLQYYDPDRDISYERQQMEKNLRILKNYQDAFFFLLTSVPQSQQRLYHCMMMEPTNLTNSLLVILLLWRSLQDAYMGQLRANIVQSMLEPLIKKHNVHYCTTVLGRGSQKIEETSIATELQRIDQMKNKARNEKKDLCVFVALILLAKRIQNDYRVSDSQKKEASLFPAMVSQVHSAIDNIDSDVLRITCLGMMLEMKEPFSFDEIKRNEMRLQMMTLFQSSLSNLSLLPLTLLFVRFHNVLCVLSTPFLGIIHKIGEKLNDIHMNDQEHHREAVFIALRGLNYSHLSSCLSKFAKRTENLSDLLLFNSTILFRYFSQTTNFDLFTNIFLSSIYLTELTFDAQILNMYINSNSNGKKFSTTKRTELRYISWEGFWILTAKGAEWITNHMQKLNNEEQNEVMKTVADCKLIEKEALSEVGKWLIYGNNENKNLRFFALYAALQMIINCSNDYLIVNVINQIFDADPEFRFKSIVEHLIASSSNYSIISKILWKLSENIFYSSKISIRIDRKDTFNCILQLELERLKSVVGGSVKIRIKPFLSMIQYHSEDIQIYLAEHLCQFIGRTNEIEAIVKEEYIATIMKWIIKSTIWNAEKDILSSRAEKQNLLTNLYGMIFTLLHNQQFPRVQKAILNGLNSIFSDKRISSKNIFLQDDFITRLEELICSYNNDSNNLLLICLLTYGQCLFALQSFKKSRKVSEKMYNHLNILLHESFSDIISIRVAFCLMALDYYSDINVDTSSNWFQEASSNTPEMSYKILLQQTLYVQKASVSNEITEHIQRYLTELGEVFINDFYDYLCNRCNSNYLSDPTPDYVCIALTFSEKNIHAFRNLVKKSSVGEAELKKELYQYFCYFCDQNDIKDSLVLIKLYVAFGVLTNELIQMLMWLAEKDETNSWNFIQNIREVSDRNVIENLFQLLHLMVVKEKLRCFSNVLNLIIQLAQAHIVSMLEVHQNVSPLISKILLEDDNREWYIENNILNHLLNLTCIQNIPAQNSKAALLNENDIDEYFEGKFAGIKTGSRLCLRKDYLLSHFRSSSDQS